LPKKPLGRSKAKTAELNAEAQAVRATLARLRTLDGGDADETEHDPT
jgi:hypothetical protein